MVHIRMVDVTKVVAALGSAVCSIQVFIFGTDATQPVPLQDTPASML